MKETLPTNSTDGWKHAYCYNCMKQLVASRVLDTAVYLNPFEIITCTDGVKYRIYYEQYTTNY